MNHASPSIEDLFFAASERQDLAARAAYLDEACGGDTDLRRRVEDLLAAEPKVSRFLESPALTSPFEFGQAVSEENPGSVIGPYKLLEPIGEGGMGVVYLAEQTKPVRRKVALKVIKPGMDTKQVIARFEAERQALALMDHPNIAHVHDGGATESGRPYFVMELVRGIPITDYCDRERLPIRERLELFVLVCRAVQHAHQKGIIHRDLKPSNILVTLHDGVPVPKVIDFGVAKATGQSLTDNTIYTASTQFVGTPLYMSPEQAELSRADVDTRSDIYSLGVLLYELLTGTTPFDADTLRAAAFDEMWRIIREQEPPRPRSRLSALGDSAIMVSANRQTSPRKLEQTFRGELDWIVMKCLEKDRTRRYETANDLARDLMRYLADQPVEACPPSAWYQLAKSVRRHRVALATAGIVSAALIAGTAVSTWQAIRATKAEKRTATALDEAKQQRRLAERHLHAALLRQVRQTMDLRYVDQAQEILDTTRTGLDGTDLRNFAWYYLRRLARRELVLLPGSDLGLFATSLSRDGRTLAALYSWSLIVLLDLPSERPRLTLTAAPGTKWVAPRLTTDGRILVVIDHAAGEVKPFELEIWDAATGRLGATRSIGDPLPRPTHGGITHESTEFLAGERMIAYLWEGETGRALIRIWKLTSTRGRISRWWPWMVSMRSLLRPRARSSPSRREAD
jgi:serine/threonine protein kinase